MPKIAARDKIETFVKTPDPVDVHVGERLRLMRRQQDLSQTDLAKRGGITFQQVQKYEKGANRVSASRLMQFAQALGVPVASFFDGLEQPLERVNARAQRAEAFANTAEGFELIERLLRLTPAQRRLAKGLLDALYADANPISRTREET